jgi:hypothetical protein
LLQVTKGYPFHFFGGEEIRDNAEIRQQQIQKTNITCKIQENNYGKLELDL